MFSDPWNPSQLTLVNLEDKPVTFFKRLIDASCSAIVICDATREDQPIIYVNPAFEAITGYRLDEALGRNARFLQGEDRDQPEVAQLRACLAQGRSYSGTLRNYRKDGTLFWSRMHIFPMPEGGVVTNHAAFLEDVTLMVEAKHALERTHRRLSSVLESISDGFFTLDHEWRFTYVNARGAAWLQRRPEDLIGKNMWEEFPEGVGGPFHQTYDRALATQAFAGCESYYPPLGIWIEVRAHPSRDGLIVFFADISARKEAEARLIHLATHDSLTGLHNRLSCMRALDGALARAGLAGERVAVLFVDLDHFKEVNDAHGHRVGDLALQEIGRRLARFANPVTTVARISGDEFVFVLEDGDADAARLVAGTVLQRLAAPIQVDGHVVAIGASIGIAVGEGDELTPD
jgi:diguanylate cyclase (GGDEF)-like protein/PAS domain S-box-containing protein